MKNQLIACVLTYVGFLLVLGFQTVVPVIPEPGLYGVVTPAETPSLSVTSLWDGSFQKEVEGAEGTTGWIDRHAGLRSVWIKTDNQINYSVFRTPSSANNPQEILLGKDNWLYERGVNDEYINNYLGLGLRSSEELHQLAVSLRRLQDELDRRGIVFLVVVSPSKHSLYPEYLPQWVHRQREVLDRKYPGRKSNYEVLRPMLDEQGVRWIDAVARFREEKRNQEEAGQEYRLFPRGGTHWSHYGASLIAETMLARLKELTGKDLMQLSGWKVSVDCHPVGTDNDLGDVLNLWTTSISKGPTPHAYVMGTPGRWKPDVLWVGTSFSFTLTDLMDLFQVYRRRETLFMFARRLTYPGHGDNLLKNVPFDWSKELLPRDIIILEMNEAPAREFDNGFAAAALEFLDSQPPP